MSQVPAPTSQSQQSPIQNMSSVGLWDEALRLLGTEERLGLPEFSYQTYVKIDDLITLVQEKQKQCEKRCWKFPLGGHDLILRDYANKIMLYLDKFKEVGDVAVNFDPVHASLPWAAVRFILTAVIADRDQMTALLMLIERVSRIVSRSSVIESLYSIGSSSVGKCLTWYFRLFPCAD
jgi:hypothetical protein